MAKDNLKLSGNRFLGHPGRFILTCYVVILIPSMLLLMTEAASKTGLFWIDALFMATSALTVTGLEVVDTTTHFSWLGHLWLLLLMQIGGLGQMTVTMLILVLFGRRMSIQEQKLVREELNQHPTANVRQLIFSIALFALLLESLGAICLATQWVPEFGFIKGFYLAIFHAVSAFNNAGFSLLGLSEYAENPVVGLSLPVLFILGGLGFTVIVDLLNFSKSRKTWRLSLHSKLVLVTSFLLLSTGTVMLFLLERENPATLGHFSSPVQWLNAFFLSSTTRTAGFSTVDLINMSHASLLIMMVWMFIGAGSSSTGGGIKVSTFAIAIIATKTFLEGGKDYSAFKRAIPEAEVLKSLAIIVVSFFSLITAAFILMVSENARFDIVLFEAISAFSTVGLTVGLTAGLSKLGKLVIIVLMIIGRLGPLTLALALIPAKPSAIRYAEEDVLTG